MNVAFYMQSTQILHVICGVKINCLTAVEESAGSVKDATYARCRQPKLSIRLFDYLGRDSCLSAVLCYRAAFLNIDLINFIAK